MSLHPSRISAILMVTFLIGCADEDVPLVCSPSDVQVCLCTATVSGAQTCRDDGVGWAECACEAPELTPDSQISAPTLFVPSNYEFNSRFRETSSVGYAGQVARHLLLHDFLALMGRLTAELDQGHIDPVDIGSLLLFFFEDIDLVGGEQHGYRSPLPTLQQTYDDVSTNKNLRGKLAGNDPIGQHVDWAEEGMIGWRINGNTSPQELVDWCIGGIIEQAARRVSDEPPRGPNGLMLSSIHVLDSGVDVRALLAAFLGGAIAFSQAADDYLDVDLPGKGINGDNLDQRFDGPFTDLEHFWDEGFGYFGAARDLAQFDLSVVAEGGALDINGDGAIDLTSEANFGASTWAATLDRTAPEPTDFTMQVFQAFVHGRALLHHRGADLSESDRVELTQIRDRAITGWESVLAASAIRELNLVLQQMNAPSQSFRFELIAEAWSSMKGHLLSLQFNPRSPLSKSNLVDLHALVGQAPVLSNDESSEAYQRALNDVKHTLAQVYGVDAANLGDARGYGGWGHPEMLEP